MSATPAPIFTISSRIIGVSLLISTRPSSLASMKNTPRSDILSFDHPILYAAEIAACLKAVTGKPNLAPFLIASVNAFSQSSSGIVFSTSGLPSIQYIELIKSNTGFLGSFFFPFAFCCCASSISLFAFSLQACIIKGVSPTSFKVTFFISIGLISIISVFFCPAIFLLSFS